MNGKIWSRGAAIAVALFAGACFSAAPASAQDVWAALAPNGENTAPVVRAPTRDLARDRALAACRRVSKTCTDTPALTQNLDDLFGMVCCSTPRWACVAAPRPDRAAAVAESQRVLDQHGFSQCKTTAFLSARTGERLPLTAAETRDNRDDRDRDTRDAPTNRDARNTKDGGGPAADLPPQRDY